MTNSLRIVFMGTPDFALPPLEALHGSGHEVVCVYTQPPRPKGRGRQVRTSPVHDYADSHGIEVRTPKSFKKERDQMEFLALHADVAVVAAYGLILPKAVLDGPTYGCINIHASLLPRWRGASPIQHAILEGDDKTGISLMQMDEGLDTGPVIMERAVAVREQTTATSLHDELSALGGAMIVEAINRLAADGKLDSEPQDDSRSTYAPLLRRADGRVNWHRSAAEIDRQVRALNPWPGVWCEAGGRRLKILEADIIQGRYTDEPGTIVNKDGHIACGGSSSVLRLLKIQPENAKAMDFTAALNGGYVGEGETLS